MIKFSNLQFDQRLTHPIPVAVSYRSIFSFFVFASRTSLTFGSFHSAVIIRDMDCMSRTAEVTIYLQFSLVRYISDLDASQE